MKKTINKSVNDCDSCQKVFSIRIKNNTDDKLYNVSVFNRKHDKQDKITYSSCIINTDYDLIVTQINFKPIKVNSIYMSAFCEFHKFTLKQLTSKLNYKHTKPNGYSAEIPTYHCLHPKQYQMNTIIIDNFNKEIDAYSDIILPYLMPETEVILYFYYENND